MDTGDHTRAIAERGLARSAWAQGAALLAVCAALVWLRGVRWDETYEFAQVLLGRVVYPPGHPVPLHVRGMYSVQHWAHAGWMALVPGEAPANALRNLLFLFATVAPPFFLARLWSGRWAWGWAAAALALLGPHVPFHSNYPVQVWPDLYSNGHIGGAWMLLGLAALAAGRTRAAYAMAGLAPAIHLGQAPPLIATVALHAAWSLWREGRAPLRGPLAAGALGAGLSLALWIFVRWQAPVVHVDPAEYARVFRGYMTHHASHRAIPWGTGHIALLGALAIAAVAWAAPRGAVADAGAETRGVAWVVLYLMVVAGLVYGVMAAHVAMGPDIPRALIAWMPYRLINHAGPLAIAITVALCARNRAAAWLIVAVFAVALARPTLAGMLPPVWHGRYLAGGEWMIFLLHGAAWAGVGFLVSGWVRVAVLCAGFVVVAILAQWHQFGAACAALGAVSACALRRLPVPGPYPAGGLAAALLVFAGVAAQEHHTRAHLPRSEYEENLAHFLAHASPGRPLLVPHLQEGMQARLNHPVMADMATITWVPYSPAAALAIERIYWDLYGIRIAPGPGETAHDGFWFEVWPAKSAEDWRRLSEAHGFQFVLAPGFMRLDLESFEPVGGTTLYRVPFP